MVFQRAREVDGRHRAEGVGTGTAAERLERVAAVGIVATSIHVGDLLGVPVVLRGTVLNILSATKVVSVGKLTGRHNGGHAVSMVWLCLATTRKRITVQQKTAYTRWWGKAVFIISKSKMAV